VKPWRFCPLCGGRLEPVDGEGGARCPSCDRSWYRNPAPTVGAAIVKSGRILVTVRARAPEKDKIDVPGGFLHEDEDPLAALRREVREEVGLEIDVCESDFVQAVPHRYGADGDWILALGFRARFLGGDPVPTDDVRALEWVGLDDLDELDWAWPHDRELARKALLG
jgi:ADP-ribose pyrophosphatase YjhB (NUDIX family)